jgi:ABC-type transport system involved in multi-copper enzyme maturation permease subunit
MLSTLIEKELKNIILGPKFVATFTVCSILIILSVFIGIQDYKTAVKAYEAGTQLAEQEMQEKNSWMMMSTRTYRKPDPKQIFVSGINNDIGRFSRIRTTLPVKLTNSNYSDDPIFAVFRFIDLSFIFQIVLSLFAILFTYDAINGERERGTLRLTFANSVPRAKYIFAKFTGSWLGLIVPILIPILIGLLLIVLYKIPLTPIHWGTILSFLGISLLYFTFFIALGIFVSALTKQSVVSFLVLLVVWVFAVLIIPRVGVMAAGKIAPVPSTAEIEAQTDGFSKDRWDKYHTYLEEIWQKREAEMEGLTEEERETYRDNHMWDWMEESDKEHKAVQTDVNEFSRKLHEDLRNKKVVQQRLAYTLSRFSPASSYQLAVMNLAETDINLKSRYENDMENFHKTFIDYTEKKQAESGDDAGGIRITFNSDTGMKMDIGGRDKGKLDTSDRPRFLSSKQSFAEILKPALGDFGLLLVYSFLALVGAFVGFLRYDVR